MRRLRRIETTSSRFDLTTTSDEGDDCDDDGRPGRNYDGHDATFVRRNINRRRIGKAGPQTSGLPGIKRALFDQSGQSEHRSKNRTINEDNGHRLADVIVT